MLICHVMGETGELLRFLAKGFLYPESEEFIQSAKHLMKGLSEDLGTGLISLESEEDIDDLQSEYMRLFVTSPSGVAAPPYASCYIHAQGLLLQEGAQEALRYYQDVGLEPVEGPEPPDHIAIELAFLGHLVDTGNWDVLERFLRDHLLKWFPAFKARLMEATPSVFYQALCQITGEVLQSINKKGGLHEKA